MIAFDLQCENGHAFEGWFKNSAAFDEQQKKGLVSCPICSSVSVSKALSRFGIMKVGQIGRGDHQDISVF